MVFVVLFWGNFLTDDFFSTFFAFLPSLRKSSSAGKRGNASSLIGVGLLMNSEARNLSCSSLTACCRDGRLSMSSIINEEEEDDVFCECSISSAAFPLCGGWAALMMLCLLFSSIWTVEYDQLFINNPISLPQFHFFSVIRSLWNLLAKAHLYSRISLADWVFTASCTAVAL